jgi:FkbM family methyltransferase
MSFEPVAATFERLSRVAADDPHWSVHQLALGSADGTAEIHIASDTSFSSLLNANDFSRKRFRQSVVASQQLVDVKRLDEVLEPVMAARPDTRLFVKLDTQGYDLEAFSGLGAYVDLVMVVQSELSLIPIYDGMPHWTHSVSVFEAAGFAVAGMFPVNHDSVGRVIEYDTLLVRAQPNITQV